MNRIVYLHGFASSPESKKARFFRERFQQLGITLEVPDLAPSGLETLTISDQLRIIEDVAGGDAISLMGSSMGGYLAALYALRHTEVETMVLMAPAFDFAQRWTSRLGPESAALWRESGYLEMHDYRTDAPARVGYMLIEDGLQYPAFPEFQQPAIVFHGMRDDVVDYEGSVEFAARHPNVRLQLFDAGHELTEVMEEMWQPLPAFFAFR